MFGFSKWLIARQPSLYLKWVWDSFLYGLGRTGACFSVRWLAIALVVSMPFLYFSRRSRASSCEPGSLAHAGGSGFCVYGLLLLGAGFLVGKLALMVLVNWPWDRFLFAALLFLPSALCAALFEVWRNILGVVRRPRRGAPCSSLLDS